MRRRYVIDLGIGNIGSVARMLSRLGRFAEFITKPPLGILTSPVILPGVGHFSRACHALNFSWRSWLNHLHEPDQPLLAICLGAQVCGNLGKKARALGLAGYKSGSVSFLRSILPSVPFVCRTWLGRLLTPPSDACLFLCLRVGCIMLTLFISSQLPMR